MKESYLLCWDSDARKKAYGKLVGEEMPVYDPKQWRHEAVEKRDFELDRFDCYWAKDGFEESNWYKFQQAVIDHRELALQILKPVLGLAARSLAKLAAGKS